MTRGFLFCACEFQGYTESSVVGVDLGDAEGCECALEATCAEVLAVQVALDDYVLKLGCHDVRG